MNYRFLIPMLIASYFELVVVSMVRVTTSYRAIELGLSPLWVGIITATFSLLPVFLSLRIGRIVDRGFGPQVVWSGAFFLMLGCAGLAMMPSLPGLIIFSAILGAGHIQLGIGIQVLCAVQPGPGVMERMLGNYMVATAIGQGTGPFLVGLTGGSAAIPPTQLLFTLCFGASVILLVAALFLRSGQVRSESAKTNTPVLIGVLLRTPGFVATMAVGVVVVVAQDLTVVYMPYLGTERGIPVDVVGSLLTVRAIFAVLARICYTRLNTWLGGVRLMVIATLAGAAAYVAIALPLPLPAMYLAIAVIGSAIGIAVTVSIASLMALVETHARGITNSLRTAGTRLGQVVIPFAAGALATAAGVASIFLLIGAVLTVAATAAHFARRS